MAHTKKLKYESTKTESWREQHFERIIKKFAPRAVAETGLFSSSSPEHDAFIKAIGTSNWDILKLFRVKYNNVELKKRFFEQGNYQNSFGATFDPIKAALGNVSVLTWLVHGVGAPLNKMIEGKTYLHSAVFTSRNEAISNEMIDRKLEVIEFLLNCGVPLEAKDSLGTTVIEKAVVSSRYKFRLADSNSGITYPRFEKLWEVDPRSGPVRVYNLLEELGANTDEAEDLMQQYIENEITPFGVQVVSELSSFLGSNTTAEALRQLYDDPLGLTEENEFEIEWAAGNLFPDTFKALYNLDPKKVQEGHLKRQEEERKKESTAERGRGA